MPIGQLVAQGVQLAAMLGALVNVPTEQLPHTVLFVVVHAVAAYWLAGHSVHGRQLGALVWLPHVDPATQLVHTVLTPVEQAVDTRVPTGQVAHEMHAGELTVVV